MEIVSDSTKWLGLKYKNSDKNRDQFELRFHEEGPALTPSGEAKVQGFRTSLCPTDRELHWG